MGARSRSSILIGREQWLLSDDWDLMLGREDLRIGRGNEESDLAPFFGQVCGGGLPYLLS